MRISSDKDVKYGAFWGKLVFGKQNVLNLFGGIEKILYIFYLFPIFDTFVLSFPGLGFFPSSYYSFWRFEEKEKPRLVSAKKATR